VLTTARPLLERQRVFHSRDPDETRAFLRGKEFRFELAGREAEHLDVRINGVYFPSLYIGYIQYGPAVWIEARPERNDYWVQLPTVGRFQVSVGGDTVECGPRLGAVSSPTRGASIRSEQGSGRTNLSLSAAALDRQLAALLGRSPVEPIEFATRMSLDDGCGRRIGRYLRLAIDEFEHPAAAPWSMLTMTEFEQLILTELLMSHPHNYSEALRAAAKSIAPRDVKRAIDYLEAHLDGPITVAALAAASEVAGRTLFQHFHAFKGVSPMRYLRDLRFARTRKALLQADPEASVTDIAAAWGFTHLGRFAVEYRRRFGESPSDTIRHARKIS